jgi:hypothetical protein
VLADDYSSVKKRFFTRADDTRPSSDNAYSMLADVNGSGTILADDYSEVKKRFFTRLPDTQAAAAAAAPALRMSGATRSLFSSERVLA